MVICLNAAWSYPGAYHYSCGTPRVEIEDTLRFWMPFGVALLAAGGWFAKPAPTAARWAGRAAFLSLATWLAALAVTVFYR